MSNWYMTNQKKNSDWIIVLAGVFCLIVIVALVAGSSNHQSNANAEAQESTVEPENINNYAPFPESWNTSPVSWGWNDTYNTYPVTWQGIQNCMRFVQNPRFVAYQINKGWTGQNEINCLSLNETTNARTTRVSVHAGDRVVFKVWAWITPSSVGSADGGLCMYIDVYTNHVRITELQGKNGVHGVSRLFVPWGHSGWMQLVMDFTVADSYKSENAPYNYLEPTSIIPILQLNNYNLKGNPAQYSETGYAYVYGTELYINP